MNAQLEGYVYVTPSAAIKALKREHARMSAFREENTEKWWAWFMEKTIAQVYAHNAKWWRRKLMQVPVTHDEAKAAWAALIDTSCWVWASMETGRPNHIRSLDNWDAWLRRVQQLLAIAENLPLTDNTPSMMIAMDDAKTLQFNDQQTLTETT